MRNRIVILCMLLCSMGAATAQLSVAIGVPNLTIGINLPLYPELVPVPGYPVYYAPRLNSNYFFYDGAYWVYQDDNWYASSWYNGPWARVGPEFVPLFVLRIPVRYYRQPPAYFRGWQFDAPPRWDEHWGDAWTQRRSGWNRWDRNSAPAPAPLPVYQQKYSGDRYPGIEQQQVLHSQNYRHEARDPVLRQQYQAPRVQTAPAPSAPAVQAPQRNSAVIERPAATQALPQQRDRSDAQPGQARKREADRQPPPQSRPHGQEAAPPAREAAQGAERGQRHDENVRETDREKDQDKADERGRDHRK